MQSQIQELFREVHKREITDKELQRILAVCRALDLKKNDAFIAIIASLELYGSAFDKQLEKIEQSISKTTEAAAKQSAERTKEHLAEIEKKTVIELASRVDKTAERIAKLKSQNVSHSLRALAIFSALIPVLFITFEAGAIFRIKHEIESGHHILSDKNCIETSHECQIFKGINHQYRNELTVHDLVSKHAKIANIFIEK